jgi:hypothetical protein
MHTIYRLYDPRDGLTFYVGRTEDVYQRFLEHIQCSGSNAAKNMKIMELRHDQVMVGFEALETMEDTGYARIREAYWIRHYDALGHPLTNIVRPERELKAKVIMRSTQATKKLVERQLAGPKNSPTVSPQERETILAAARAQMAATGKEKVVISKLIESQPGWNNKWWPKIKQVLDEEGV